MKLQVLSKNNKKLRLVSSEVTKFDHKLRKLIVDMTILMKKERGVGLAAPQVGINERLIIVSVGSRIEPMVNPVIIEASDDTIVDSEGCLSIKGTTGKVKRNAAVNVEWVDGHGNAKSKWFEGFEARIIQHEIDHLNGILYTDKLEDQ